MKRFKGFILPVLLTALLLGASISFPLVYFEAQNSVLLSSPHPRQEIQGKIDPQAEEIYLVQAIQQLYQTGVTLDADTVSREQPALQKALRRQLEDMMAAGILDASAASLYRESDAIHLSSLNQNGLILDRYMIIGSSDTEPTANCYFQPEEKTGKLLYFGVGKQGQALAGASVNELSRRYIRYLGLESLGDWTENEVGMISQKAQLQIFCLQTENAFLLQIAPVGYYSSENTNDPLLLLSVISELLPDENLNANASE